MVVELLLELGDDILQLEGRNRLFLVIPELLDQLRVPDGEFALRSQLIVTIEFLLKVALEEVV